MSAALLDRLRARIAAEGPISVAEYMATALGDPAEGYYMRREPFGAAGDFVTAPEISQMFGELVGLWCLAAFEAIGTPQHFALTELGPGRGTLMADLLHTARIRPGFVAAASILLVETSPRLRELQAARLAGHAPQWHDGLATLPPGPRIVIANEFFDALPVRQFVRTERGWAERVVGLAGDRLAFGLGPGLPDPHEIPAAARSAPPGTIIEVARTSAALMTDLAADIAATGGALIVIDYGHARSGTGDTLQAVRAHAYADPLEDPGSADLTCHVDFAALARAATAAGAVADPVETQAAFLLRHGLVERAGRLGAGRDTATQDAIRAAVQRLAGNGPGEMGDLFKVLVVRGR
ncbi:class I SAM-dependent methyltransferase [Methylobrevis albus]|uniref:SAM-dependent methyltransferase n=1 Tax=Methylobrevis albus TaxID=2793297 RepID=A0A931I3P9_9HYPH|nr:SAM-dependent methyltransferase [Methylobrevis albus]MBH0239292.1 SAM-dependent methyltransferase [Methylobrevis albus]